MFRITKKADYAVFILAYMAQKADQHGLEHLVSAQELSSLSSLNKSLVANLLKDLTKAGILGSVRGARGGYHLARPATEICFEEILRVVEGPFTFVECAQDRLEIEQHSHANGQHADGHHNHDQCTLSPLCGSRGPLLVLHARIINMLRGLSLAELSGLPSCASVRQGTAPEVEAPLRKEALR
ncbi:MAG: Rrf2 family transcriptional regulator [Planctomycetota bacterium]